MPKAFISDPALNLIIGFVLGIIGSLIAASIHPPLINFFIKLFRRKINNLRFSYKNHGVPNIHFGVGENRFDADWSPASFDTVHLYNQRADTKVIGTIRDTSEFHLITDIIKYLHPIVDGTAISQGQFFILKNPSNKYAIVQIFEYRPGPIGGEGDMHIKYRFVKPITQ